MRDPSHADDPTPGQPESFDARSASPGEITSDLRAARDGNPAAFDALYTRLYDELRRIARRVTDQPPQCVFSLKKSRSTVPFASILSRDATVQMKFAFFPGPMTLNWNV